LLAAAIAVLEWCNRRQRDRHQRAEQNDEEPLDRDAAASAMSHVLDQIGAGLSLEDLDDDQLDEISALAESLEDRESDAVLVAIAQHRESKTSSSPVPAAA
jgi:hypothetical protein